MQNDGDLVLKDSHSTTIWSSMANGQKGDPYRCAPYALKVRDIVQLTLVDCNSEPLWSGTN